VEKLEAHHMLLLSKAIIQGATARKETRGAHVRLDYPGQSDDVYRLRYWLDENDEWIVKEQKR
jgi:succinate dehydrogenase / fumarate reductase flavoprotein subunit/fumarate reductase (CoM/CoB) subunit A